MNTNLRKIILLILAEMNRAHTRNQSLSRTRLLYLLHPLGISEDDMDKALNKLANAEIFLQDIQPNYSRIKSKTPSKWIRGKTRFSWIKNTV